MLQLTSIGFNVVLVSFVIVTGMPDLIIVLEFCRMEEEDDADSATPMPSITEEEMAAEEEVEEDIDVSMLRPRARPYVLAAHRWRPASETERDAAMEYIRCTRVNCQVWTLCNKANMACLMSSFPFGRAP